MKEIWKDIIEYKGLYQISSYGNIKSLNYARSGKSKILKPFNKKVYYCVYLCKNKTKKIVINHRLVGQYFIPNPNNYPCINHKDGNKLNNKINNLEWCTHSMNMKHAFKTNLVKHWKGEDSPMSKFKEKDILNIRKLYKTGKHTQRKLAKMFNTCCSQICYIINKKQWKHV